MRSPSPPILLLAVLFAALPGPPAAAQDAASLAPTGISPRTAPSLQPPRPGHRSPSGTSARMEPARPRSTSGTTPPGLSGSSGSRSGTASISRERSAAGTLPAPPSSPGRPAGWSSAPRAELGRVELHLSVPGGMGRCARFRSGPERAPPPAGRPCLCRRPVDTATVYDPGELDAPVRLLALGTVDTPAADGDDQASAVLGFVIGKDGRVEPCSVTDTPAEFPLLGPGQPQGPGKRTVHHP